MKDRKLVDGQSDETQGPHGSEAAATQRSGICRESLCENHARDVYNPIPFKTTALTSACLSLRDC